MVRTWLRQFVGCILALVILLSAPTSGAAQDVLSHPESTNSEARTVDDLSTYCSLPNTKIATRNVLCALAERDNDKLASSITEINRSSAVWKKIIRVLRQSELPVHPEPAYSTALDILAEHILHPEAWGHLKLLQGRYYEVVEKDDREALRHMEKVFQYGGSPSVIPEAQDRIWRLRQLEGRKLPLWKAESYRGDIFDMSNHVGKRPVVVYLWAIYCASCYETVDKITRANKRFGDDVTFVGLMADSREDERYDELARFVDRRAPWTQILAKKKTHNGMGLFKIYYHSEYGPSYPLGHIILIGLDEEVKISGMSDDVFTEIVESIEGMVGAEPSGDRHGAESRDTD